MPTRKWGSERIVNTTTAGVQSASDVAVLTGGGYVVVWQDDGVSPPTIRFQRFDAVGNKVGAEGEIGSGFVGTDIEPSVTGLADGGFYITWSNTSFSHIEGHIYDASGAFVRYQPVIFTIPPQRDSDVAAVSTGNAVVWADPSGILDPDTEVLSPDILLRTFNAAGTGGPIILVTDDGNDATDIEPAVASNGNRIAVVWSSRPFFGPDYDILCRIYDANGNALTGQFTVNNPATIDDEGAPAVAWLASNRIVVAWRDGFAAAPENIRFRILDQNGTALTAELTANETTFNAQSAPAITALPNGNFVISWSDFSQTAPDSTGTAIRLQAFGASGTKIGSEIVVNTTTPLSQLNPSVTALADSRVVVTWTDTSSDGGNIRQQIVDPRDGIVNGTNAAETLYGHDAVGDEINGAGGSDTLRGLAGNDQLYGGIGDDTAYGGKGDDTAYGGDGNDTLLGDQGDDDLFGEDGNDDLRGGLGADAIDGGAGADYASYLTASARVAISLDGTLVAEGEAVGDTLTGIERLSGGAFDDHLRGNSAVNSLLGQAGADTLEGLGGGDTISGGLGADTMTGGTGNDGFVYLSQTEVGDTITDFSSSAAGNDDQFRFRGSAFGGLAVGTLDPSQFQSSASNVAGNASIRFFYETDTQTLRFDADGSGAGSAPIVIATLQAGATMTNADIVIV